MLATKGLTVVDVNQQWCGPCRAVVSLLRKIKNELDDDLLHLATAEADIINALEKYRGKCEPTFLFYGVSVCVFTSLKLPSPPAVPASKSYTVAIVKPDAVAHGKANEIIMKIQDAGFEVLAHEERTLTEVEARDFYQHKAAEVQNATRRGSQERKTREVRKC
uniref:Nucleoside diphosphate kinase B n=1 Tax=Scophthalmus maximus TaxID=52904 RepID=A0A8D3AEQ3_SCOMX